MITPLLPVYRRMPVAFDHGKGMSLFDADGKEYLDFYSGIGVNALGHAHPHLVKTIQEQAEKLWHVSNLFEIPGQQRLAERLVEATFADTVFFSNSGAESIELAIKMVRKYHFDKGNKGKYRMITFASAFHGRTLAGIAAAGQEKLVHGFDPLPDGFDVVDFCDLEAVKAAITPETGGIMVEPIQGEGGIRPIPAEVMQGLRKIADDNGLLLVLDEIQCGMGRTGKLFTFEWSGITPDIVTSAKGIGGGFPVGAVLATEDAASGMTAGTHGTTYGGGPLAMAVSNAVMDVLLGDGFLEHVRETSAMLRGRLEGLRQKHATLITEVRGHGLMCGLRVPSVEPRLAVPYLVEKGLVVAPAGENVLRFLPPLIVTEDDIEKAVNILDEAFTDWEENGVPSA